MGEESPIQGLTLDQKTIDVLVANIIPTSKYFESRFDNLQYQVNEIKDDIKDLDQRQNERFAEVNKRFEQIDKRFEQIDARFISLQSDMDRRFQQVNEKLDKIIDRIDCRIDEGLRENRSQMMRMFTFAMTFSAISMAGLLGKMFKLF